MLRITPVALFWALLAWSCNNSSSVTPKVDSTASAVSAADSAARVDKTAALKARLKIRPCGFVDLEGYFFPPDQYDADTTISNIVGEILDATGMHLNNSNRNFYLTESAMVKNAEAVPEPIITPDSLLIIYRYIICSPTFLKDVRTKCSNAAIYVLLAHEISHHLNADNFMESDLPEDRRQAELRADSFAGYLCYELGTTRHFSLDSCTIVYQIYGDSADTKTHPKKETRINSFTNGWNTAKKYSALSCEALNAIEKNPQLVIQEFSTNNLPYVRSMRSQYISAIASQSAGAIDSIRNYAEREQIDTAVVNLRGDALPVIRDKDNQLINKEGDVLKNARLRPLSDVSNANTPKTDYLLDKKNTIWARYPNGVPYIAGYMRKR